MRCTPWYALPFLLIVFSPALSAQVVINEIMYDPDSPEPEWIELYNPHTVPVDISGWRVQDRTTSKPMIPTGIILPNHYLVLTKDSAAFRAARNPDALVVQVSLAALNNGGDDIVLRDTGDTTIDSVAYASSWGGKDGISLERIEATSPSNKGDSWSSSMDSSGATPGRRNSVAPVEYDLALHSVVFNADTREATIVVVNSGSETSVAGTLLLYHDANNDTVGTIDEAQSGRQLPPLESGDSLEIVLLWKRTLTVNGEVGLVVIDHPGEERPEDNAKRFIVRQKLADTGVIINEIMYDPDSPEPEWVELYNRGELSVNLQDWIVHDASNGRPKIPEYLLRPDTYVVITSDTESLQGFREVPSSLLETDLPALNNNGDDVVLRNQSGTVIDSLRYAKDWGGDGGRSLERKLPTLPSDKKESWETSRDPSGATPGFLNSTKLPEVDMVMQDLLFHPEQENLTATVINSGTAVPEVAEVVLYYDANDNSAPDLNEEIERQTLPAILPDDSVSIHVDWSRPLQLEGERAILLLTVENEERPDDNMLSVIVRQSTVDTGLIINEIMYDPDDPEPEWVELYNRGSLPVDVEGWRIKDATGTSPPLLPSILLPGEYLIVTPDTTELLRKRTIPSDLLQSPLPAFNNSGDNVVILNIADVVVDSVHYRGTWGGRDGISLERKGAESLSNDSLSWTSTVDPSGGTPGRKNSYKPILNDLALYSVVFHPNSSSISGYVKNQGLNRSDPAELQLYLDKNSNGKPERDENLDEETVLALDPNDSLEISFNWSRRLTADGERGLLFISLDNDQRVENNLQQFLAVSPTVDTGVVINEIMYLPSAPEPEWIELYNYGELPVDLTDWVLHDASRTRPALPSYKLLPNNFVVVVSDSSLLRSLRAIPSEIIEVDLPAFNNSGDAVVLRNSSGDHVDSLYYTADWGGSDGRSLERRFAEFPSVERGSWRTSTDSTGATPGRDNAVRPPEINVALQSLLFDPEDSHVIVTLLNTGLQPSSEVDLILYYDTDLNGKGESFEEENRAVVSTINPGDSAMITMQWERPLTSKGEQGIVEVRMLSDGQDNDNVRTFLARSRLATTGTVINELMYAPNASEPEWLELYNNDSLAADLVGWSISDASGMVVIDEGIIEPKEYLLITSDSTALRSARAVDSSASILQVDLPTFNNGEDEVVLRNRSGQTVDSLHYFSSWGGRSGTSLERRYFTDPTNDSMFWSSSVYSAGGTPGWANSILPPLYNLKVDSGRFDPSLSEVKVQLINNGIEAVGVGEIRLFHDANQNNEGEVEEELFRANTPNLLPGEMIVLNAPWQRPLIDEGEFALVVVAQTEDQDDVDNRVRLFIRREPLDSGLVITEIMYDPISLGGVAGAEYVEVYNMADRPVLLEGWSIVEGSGVSKTILEPIPLLPPKSFGLIASDSGVYLRYPYLLDSLNIVVLHKDFGLNNSGDELVLLNPNGRVIDSIDYSDNWHWDELVDTRGVSLERLTIDSESNDRHNWSSSVAENGGTPGAPNSRSLPVVTSSAELSVQPSTISPDGDGFEDFVRIAWKLPSSASRLMLEIYDRHGRRVARPMNNLPSSPEGSFIWDGLDDAGEQLPIGLYVVRIVSYDSDGGRVSVAQETLVVAEKL